MKKNSFYITTTIPYVNADPHIGFALELVQSDALARYHRLIGEDVFFSTGTDEYGQKIWEASKKKGIPVEEYVDHYAQEFMGLKDTLNLFTDNFIRTTSDVNIKAAQEFWRLCQEKGDIYKSKYVGLYCVGCETFYPAKDLIDGKCPIHLTPVETIEEENYFFRLSKYREALLKYLSKDNVILPEWRRAEAIDYVTNAMEDFSVSRSAERLSWGIAIPGDDTQVMYVWFGAFINYISTLGWPTDMEKFQKFWVHAKTIQTAGKDMVKFQSVMWQGMLMSAGIKNTDTILYHGFITGEGGIKMSKSLGNVINPADIVKEYGTDALRYFLLREISSFEDSPFTTERFKDAYNAGLANGLGNLTSRIMKMVETNLEEYLKIPQMTLTDDWAPALKAMNNFNIAEAINVIFKHVQELDELIQNKQPFKLIKTNKEEAIQIIKELLIKLHNIGQMLSPILPETSKKITEITKSNKMPTKPLFLRKE